MSIALLMIVFGMIPIFRFVYLYAIGEGDGHVQSLVLGGALLVCGYISLLVGLLSDVVATNRRLGEEIVAILRRS